MIRICLFISMLTIALSCNAEVRQISVKSIKLTDFDTDKIQLNLKGSQIQPPSITSTRLKIGADGHTTLECKTENNPYGKPLITEHPLHK